MGYVVFMEMENKQFQPVSAIVPVGRISGEIANHHGEVLEEPSGEFAGLNAYDMAFWNDQNNDGIPQRSECEIIKAKRPGTAKKLGESPFPMANGWGVRMNSDDLSFYVAGPTRIKPIRITSDGRPVFSIASIQPVGGRKDRGDMVAVPGTDTLLVLSGVAAPDHGWMRGVDIKNGKELWKYPNLYNHVHGSHKATMPAPGLLIGPLKIAGVADLGADIGSVFFLRGNLGQDFYMTADGLYIGALFQDTRLPSPSLPGDESQLYGMPMEMFSNGGEPFNGWFGVHDDAQIRMVNGLPGQAAMINRITGLNSIKRIKGKSVSLTASLLARTANDNETRKKANSRSTTCTMTAMAAPSIDGYLNEWDAIEKIQVKRTGQPASAKVAIAYDATHLYAAFDVQDTSPWVNTGRNYKRLFKTGDCLDLQLGTGNGRDPGPNDFRLLISQVDQKNVALLMRPHDKTATEAFHVNYHSPVGDKFFDRIEILDAAKVAVVRTDNGYTVEIAVPWANLPVKANPGTTLRGDVGLIISNAAGTQNSARIYWLNQDTGLVNDEPQEAWFSPARWGDIHVN